MKTKEGQKVEVDGVRYELDHMVSRDYVKGVNIWVARRLDTLEMEYVEVK